MFRWLLSILAFAIASPSHAEYIQGSDFFHGNWAGAAYTDDTTGEFSYCAVSAAYRSGNTLYFALTKNYTFQIGLMLANNAFNGYSSFPATVTVDRYPSVFPTAKVFDNLAVVDMPNTDVALDQIKRGRTLFINSQFGNIPFDLTGTYKVLDKAYGCARKYFNYSSASVPQARPKVAKFGQASLFKLATYTITDLGLSDFDFLNEERVATMLPNLNSDEHVFWEAKNNGLVGGVIATYEPTLVDLKDTDSLDLGYLSSLCSGDVLTGALSVKDTELPMRELVTRCVDGDEIATINASKFKLGDFVVYVVLAASAKQDIVEDPSQASRDLAVKAAKFIKSN